jgi:hypothetical protein
MLCSARKELQRRQHRFQRHKKELTFLTQHHQETCAAVARSLFLYDGTSWKHLIAELSKLFVTFLRFRRRCVKERAKADSAAETIEGGTGGVAVPETVEAFSPTRGVWEGTMHNPAPQTLTRNTQEPLSSQGPQPTREAAEEVLHRLDRNLATLTGVYVHDHDADHDDGTFSPSKRRAEVPTVFELPQDDTTAEQYEQTLSEVLGMPLAPCPLAGTHVSTEHCAGLQTAQCRAEELLSAALEHFAYEEGLTQVAPEPLKPLATSQALKELQQTLYQDLWPDTAPEDLPEAPSGLAGTLRPARSPAKHSESPHIHVVAEVNDLMHRQRAEQCAQYLELLNEKAAHRKRIIRNLMNLWQAAKASIVDRGKIPKFASESEIAAKRLNAMPQEEIVGQTKTIQQLLVREMQEPVGTKSEQVRHS